MWILVTLAVVSLAAVIATAWYVAGLQRRGKPGLIPEGKNDSMQVEKPFEVEGVSSSQVDTSNRVASEQGTQSVKVPSETAGSYMANSSREGEAEIENTEVSVIPVQETATQAHAAVSVVTETLEPIEEEADVEIETGEAGTEPSMEVSPEGLATKKPVGEDRKTASSTNEATEGDAGEGTPAKEAKPRQERGPVRPEDRGGRSRETAPKNQVESKRQRRPRTRKPEIVCWKREREWILAVELPDDFPENQKVTVVQDGKPLDEDETKESCWRLS